MLDKQKEFESTNLKNRDLEEVFVDSDDEDIQRHKDRINKHFNPEVMSEPSKGRVERQLQKLTDQRKASLTDSSEEEQPTQSVKTSTLNEESKDFEEQNDISDILDDYTSQIMQLFTHEKARAQKYLKVKGILTSAINQLTGGIIENIQKDNSKKNVVKMKEEIDSQVLIIKRMENTIIESKKENISLNKKIETLEITIHKLEYANMQQKISTELIQIIQDNHKRIEEDNKYLKDTINLYKEKEIVWQTELRNLQDKFKQLQQPLRNNSQKAEIKESDRKSIKHKFESPQSPEYLSDENNMNRGNVIMPNDYVTLHHPESSSKDSTSSRGVFDNFMKESILIKDSLFKKI